MKVFILSEGEYSDWTIKGIFSSIEKAEQAKKLISNCNDGIDEYEIDKLLSSNEAGLMRYVCRFDIEDAKFLGVENCSMEWMNDGFYENYGNNEQYLYILWAENLEYAKKIACDKLAQHLAIKNGI